MTVGELPGIVDGTEYDGADHGFEARNLMQRAGSGMISNQRLLPLLSSADLVVELP